MRPTTREPLELLFGWSDLSKYPGIFEHGSEGDNKLCAERKEVEAGDEGGRYKEEFDSPLVDYGLVPKHLGNPETMAVSADILSSIPWTKMLDFRTSLQIDWRLRWCRCYLDNAGFPYDRESFVLLTKEAWWHYQSEDWPESGGHSPTDTIDYTLQLPHLSYSPQWFAAKLLSHFRRVRSLEAGEGGNLGLAREWMLFGETWAEAKFLFNQEANEIRGAKVGKGGKRGGDERRGALAADTDLRMTEMKRLVDEGKTAKGAASAIARRKIGKTAGANLALWNRKKHKYL